MMKRLLLCLLIGLSVLAAVYNQTEPVPEENIRIYFAAEQDRERPHGPALGWEPWEPAGTPFPSPRRLMEALLNGPTEEGLRSPFPSGLTLDAWRWDPDRQGNIQMKLSEQYSGLAGISLTLADYCITMTLSQIPGVESVEILSGSYTANYRSHQQLRPEEVMLVDAVERGGESSDTLS